MRDDVAAVVARLQSVYGSWRRGTSVEQMRRDWDALFADNAVPYDFQPVDAGGVPAAWITAPGAQGGRTVLYLHGGGFRLGSIASHRALMARLSAAAGCPVLGIDYRLAPEHRFPAPLEDALAAWTWLEAECGGARNIALAGDSAGGGLVFSVAMALRDAGRPLPAACLALSPWTDLAATGETYETRRESDPIHQRPMILGLAAGYLGAADDPRDPRASPLYGDPAGLPPTFIQVGDCETVLDDSRRFAARAEEAGVVVTLEVADGMIHVFPMFADALEDGRAAIARAGAFLRAHLPDPAG